MGTTPEIETRDAPILPRLVGHRGARGSAPENTLAGLRRAADLHAPWVEFDVKLSRDGVPLLMHDDTLERTTDGRGAVAATDWADIERLDAGRSFDARFAGERVPSYAQALNLLGELGLGANVELKPCPGREVETAQLVVRITQTLWRAHLPPPVLSSFSESCLAAARDAAPELRRGLLVDAIPADWRARCERLGCVSLHVDHRKADPALLVQVLASGMPVMAYTVNEPARAAELWAAGVSCIATDFPERLAALRP